jgi:hypothetical protein
LLLLLTLRLLVQRALLLRDHVGPGTHETKVMLTNFVPTPSPARCWSSIL